MANDLLLSTKIVDDAGKTRTIPVFLPSGDTLANAQSYMTAYAPLLDAIIDGVIESAEVTIPLTLPGGLKTSAVADSTVRRGAVASFFTSVRYNWSLYVPAFSLAKIAGGAINPADTDVAAFLAAYTTGLASRTPTDGHADDLTLFSRMRESFRK